MLKRFRENFKHLKWILWLVIAIFVIFVFVDWGMGKGGQGGGSNPNVAARAGNIQISAADFQKEFKRAERRAQQMYGKSFGPEMARLLNIPQQVLNGLIDRRLMVNEARRLGLKVTDEEVRAKILGLKDGQSGGLLFMRDGVFIGDPAYRRLLAQNDMTPESFEAEMREQILLEKLNRFLSESVLVTDQEAEDDFATRNVKAKISYALLPPPASAPAVTEPEAEAYFRQNPTSYVLPEQRKAKYLLVETAKVRTAVQVSDEDIATEYTQNAETYKKGEEVHARHILYKVADPASDAAQKAKAEAAVRKLKGGADFAALAKAESDDPGSKANGGDLGAFGRGQMIKEFEEAAFGAEPKAIVGPVKTSYGYHVIQVLEKTPERVQPLYEVSAGIRARLMDKKASEEAQRLAKELSERVAKMGKPSDEELRRLAVSPVTFNETEYVGRGDVPAGLGNPAFTQALFALAPGQVSAPVSTARGEAIVKLSDTRKSGLPPFTEVKQRVIADLGKKKQDAAAMASLKQATEAEQTLEGIAKKVGQKVETPTEFGKNGPGPSFPLPKAVLDAVFSAKPGEVKGPFEVPGRGALVLRVEQQTPFDKAAFEAQKDKIKESLRTQKSDRLLQAMIMRRRNELKVERNDELLKRFSGGAPEES
jgi:peptidyl-prolyl cis-trans isomerase D